MERKITTIAPKKSLVTERKRVAAYARVSSGKDAMLHSLSAQVSYYSSMIQRNREWVFCGVYADEAKTGTKDTRAEFQRLIADCKAGKIDMIITKSISRFARNTVTLLETVRMLKGINVDVYFEEQNIHTMSGDGELMLTVLASFAQAESLSASDNIKWRIRNDFKQGIMPMNLKRLYGFVRTEDGGFEIVEEEAEVIRYMAKRYMDGLGFSRIAKELNEQGIKAPNGEVWHYSAVERILKSEKNVGDLHLQKSFVTDHISKKRKVNRGELNQYYVEDNHPGILSRELFNVLQAEMAKRAEMNKCDVKGEVYPFTGKIRCENCGAKYQRKVSHCRDKYRRVFWNCATFLRKGKVFCHTKQIPEDVLEMLCCEVLEIDNFDEEIFKDNILEISVPEWNKVTFIFYDETTVTKTWQDKSRKWTEKMKAENYEKLRRGKKSCQK